VEVEGDVEVEVEVGVEVRVHQEEKEEKDAQAVCGVVVGWGWWLGLVRLSQQQTFKVLPKLPKHYQFRASYRLLAQPIRHHSCLAQIGRGFGCISAMAAWLQSGRMQYEEIKIKAPSAAPPSTVSFYMSNVNSNTGFRHTASMVPPLVFPINTLVVEGRWQGGRVIIPDAGWRSFSWVRVESKIASLNDNHMDVVYDENQVPQPGNTNRMVTNCMSKEITEATPHSTVSRPPPPSPSFNRNPANATSVLVKQGVSLGLQFS
jgi:hypothetical protein